MEEMINIPVHNITGQEVGTVELPADIFAAKINRDLMHQALVRQLSNARQGTHSTKTRGEVNRTTAKIYRQKGTGNARHGSKKAPIFVGGGIAHGPKPRKYIKSMPRKMHRAAIRSALSVKVANGGIIVVDDIVFSEPKTKVMVSMVNDLAKGQTALVLLGDHNENVERSARNMEEAKTLLATYLNIRDILGYDKVVMPLAALDVIKGFLTP